MLAWVRGRMTMPWLAASRASISFTILTKPISSSLQDKQRKSSQPPQQSLAVIRLATGQAICGRKTKELHIYLASKC